MPSKLKHCNRRPQFCASALQPHPTAKFAASVASAHRPPSAAALLLSTQYDTSPAATHLAASASAHSTPLMQTHPIAPIVQLVSGASVGCDVGCTVGSDVGDAVVGCGDG